MVSAISFEIQWVPQPVATATYVTRCFRKSRILAQRQKPWQEKGLFTLGRCAQWHSRLLLPTLAVPLRESETVPLPMHQGQSTCNARCKTGGTDSAGRIRRAPCRWGTQHRGWTCGRPSQVAVRETEFDVRLVELGALHATRQDKADIERVLVGANFRHAWQIARKSQTQHMRGTLHRHLLE